ncbi:Saccharopine dehydrogenase / Homospermidine synthase [Metarhizium album ARSEF 1941]|uniref:Saccharopine dehydrogenase / Homospermidine synthase n=1 Tax=Metarhizium album (strain ARSEF 1941) TaxID=1081103 RepID=A0A0B2X2J3_METAS|nr:Saccharopine dehydrogenase / Homospermidine synthase [Metarhizium album ARSEF 1941]KHN99475.1 Saccharopine dehydrogenase / Homospermidine synthase [Metarhizium album ARSEF 1941]
MAFKNHGRHYDLVVFGATGYTGQLTAEHIAKYFPTSLKWAVAGRSESKLQSIIEDCKKLNPDRLPPSIEIANTNDGAQLETLAKKTFLVITTVGPYCLYGESIFRLCAENGTHYLDCTGETPWVARMINKYESTARKTGAIMIPQSGVESVPADLISWSLAQHLRTDLGALTKDVVVTVHKLNSTPSGGTLATVLVLFEQFSLKEVVESTKPFATSPIPHTSGAKPQKGFLQTILGVTSRPNLGLLTTSISATVDQAVVTRTWGLLHEIPSRRKEFYGSGFTWSEFFKARNWLYGIAIHFGLAIGSLLLVFVPPFRSLVKRFVYQPGEGVSREDMEKEGIEYRATATPDIKSNPDQKQAFCRAWFHGMTGAFLAEAARTILEDDVELGGGIFTPACLGQKYIDRASDAGFKIEVKTIDG